MELKLLPLSLPSRDRYGGAIQVHFGRSSVYPIVLFGLLLLFFNSAVVKVMSDLLQS